VQSAQNGDSSHLTGSNMPGRGFGRCDGHHEMVDLKLRKKPRSVRGLRLTE
jgi:hypothetical protein